MVCHTGESPQDTHGTPVPGTPGRPWVALPHAHNNDGDRSVPHGSGASSYRSTGQTSSHTVQSARTNPTVKARFLDDAQFLERTTFGPTTEPLASLEGKTQRQQTTLPMESSVCLYHEG